MATLTDLEQALQRVAERAGAAVVGIRGRGHGAGVVTAPGRVLTNAHNVAGGPVVVQFGGDRRVEAEATGIDLDSDLAVLAADTGDAPAISWSDTPLALGTTVFALAASGTGPRVTWGNVSALQRAFRGPRGRRIAGAVEHTAPLARGSSGGALVDAEGALLAVNTHRRGDGFYLAVPADATLRQRVDLLGRGQQPVRPRLGVALAPSAVARHLRAAVGLPKRDGLLVRALEDDGPAGRAGIRSGDLLVEAGGRTLVELDDIFGVLDTMDPSDALAVRLVRGSDEHEVTVRFTDSPPG